MAKSPAKFPKRRKRTKKKFPLHNSYRVVRQLGGGKKGKRELKNSLEGGTGSRQDYAGRRK